MPKFLAVFLMKPESLARFRAMPKAEQEAVDAEGLPKWGEWEARNAAALLGKPDMVGKTVRATRDGVAPATNDICGCQIIQADSAEAAARMYLDHPHLTVFPGDAVDIMPIVT